MQLTFLLHISTVEVLDRFKDLNHNFNLFYTVIEDALSNS